MKTTITTMVMLICIVGITFSQKSNGIISGSLLEASGDPAPFVTVILLNADSAIVKTDFTKDNGTFSFPSIGAGTYTVQTSSIQYKSHVSNTIILADGQHLKMEPIMIQPAVNELDDVQIVASRPMIEVEPDKTVFNVEGSPNASGNTGMELLRKSPGVIIDNNDNIILQGKNGVRIYIDGKPTQLSGEDLTAMLRSMQSEQIEAIEIITNPPAKYEAQGNAGIINIRLKRDKNLGTNATFTSGYNVGIEERYRAGITLNHRTKKVSMFGNYNYYDMGGENFTNLNKELNGMYQDQNGTINYGVIGHGFRGGADYFINKQHTLGFVVNGNLNERNIRNLSTTPIGELPRAGLPDSVLIADNHNNNTTDNINSNINYQFKGKKGSTVNIDLDYGLFDTSGNANQPNEYFDGAENMLLNGSYYTNTQATEIDIKTVKLDYETKLGKGKFSAGSKYASVITDNSFDFYNLDGKEGIPSLDLERTSDFTYDERVLAFYTNYAVKLSEKINLNAGVRVENTHSTGDLTSEQPTNNEVVERSYTDLFPSGGLTYAHSKTHQFGMNYSRRIDRPSYQNLNPFEFRLDELTFREGNPFLRPQYSHNFQLTHTFMSKLNTRVSYSITKDFFGQVTELKPGTDGSVIKQQNLADATNLGVNVSYPFNVTNWWSGYSSLNLNHATYKSAITRDHVDLNATTYNIFVQNNFILPLGLKLELSGWYNSPSIWGGTFVTGRMYSINTGIQKSVLDKKGNITIGIDDLFLTQRWTGESDFGGLLIDGNGGQDSRRFKIGFTYRIGNQQVKARRRQSGQAAEQKRIQQGNN
jgi:hypothetical protein